MTHVQLPLPTPSELLQGLQQALPGTELRQSPDAAHWELLHGGQVVRVRWHDEPARLELAVEIGPLPTDADDTLHRTLVSCNGLAGFAPGVRAMLEGADHRMWLLFDQPAGQCSPAELEKALLNLIDSAYSLHIWMQVKFGWASEPTDTPGALH